MSLFIMLITLGSVFAITPGKEFQEIASDSRRAFKLATEHLGSSSDPRINSLTRRIRNDQIVILEAIKDTVPNKDVIAKDSKSTIPKNSAEEMSYLNQQVKIHEEMLETLEQSESAVLKNMKPRIRSILSAAEGLQREKVQAQEEALTKKKNLKWKGP